MYIFFVIILGLAIGSFLNVVINRMKSEEKIAKGRSRCPQCKKNLKALDMVPVLSFIMLRGKCRYCSKKISWQYPAVELVTALLFVLVYLGTGDWHLVVSYWIFVSLLIIVFVYDLKHYLIADVIVIPGAILALLFSLINPSVTILESLIGLVIVAGFFLFLVLISREKWMGWGDVKLGLFVGALLGWQAGLLALLISFVLGSIVGVGLIIAKKKKMKSEVPFGTFLAVATFIALIWGQEIIGWYLSVIGY